MNDLTPKFAWSIFNIYHQIDDGLVGIYNCLHDSMLLIESANLDDLSTFESDTVDILLKEKAVYPVSFDEKSYFRYFINKLKYSPTHASFIVTLTTDCNFCCPYCFEGSISESEYMDDEIDNATINHIIDSVKKQTNIRNIYIAFFGGEPLLNKSVMWMICRRLRETLSNSHNVHFTLTTNLTLLDQNDIILLKEFAFNNVQVAIDGAKPIHDTRRATKEKQPTYDLTFENIYRLIKSDIQTMVFLNFDHKNASSFNTLIKDLKCKLPFRKLVFVLNPISPSFAKLCSKNYFMSKDVEADLFISLLKTLQRNEFNIQAFGQRDMLCIANSDISCLIDPRGRLFKCGMMLGNDNFVTGSVFDETYHSMHYQLIINDPWEDCLRNACPYLPICGGGCRSLALINGLSLFAPYCEKKTYFETVFPVVLEDEFNRLIQKGDTTK